MNAEIESLIRGKADMVAHKQKLLQLKSDACDEYYRAKRAEVEAEKQYEGMTRAMASPVALRNAKAYAEQARQLTLSWVPVRANVSRSIGNNKVALDEQEDKIKHARLILLATRYEGDFDGDLPRRQNVTRPVAMRAHNERDGRAISDSISRSRGQVSPSPSAGAFRPTPRRHNAYTSRLSSTGHAFKRAGDYAN
jgi:hypothetical protein